MDAGENRPLLTAVIGTPEAGGAGTFAVLDMLSSVGRDWQMLHGQPAKPPRFLPKLLTLDGLPFRGPNGIMFEPHGAVADMPQPDIVIIPELVVSPTAPLPNTYGPIAEWLVKVHAGGATIATICSGSLLLAQTGLLDGEEATPHWGYREGMIRHFPRVRLRPERVLVPAGAGHRLITAGGATSWYDLLLYLISRFGGPEEARRVAKLFLVQTHRDGQLPFAGLCALRQHEDQVVAEAQMWIADNYSNQNPVAAMVARSGLTERSFLRRFRQATGLPPLEYVQTLRIEEAKQLLETGDTPLDDVATEVGYAEPASFRRLFRRMVGISPSTYRRQRLPSFAAYH